MIGGAMNVDARTINPFAGYENGVGKAAATGGTPDTSGKTTNVNGNTTNVNGIEECQTCRDRKYQDGSDDPGVSFKAPTSLSPAEAATAVYSHEREHYTREAAKAEEEGREVVSNDIKLFTSVCAECGKPYVSGGETTTVTRKKAETASFAKDFFDNTVGKSPGAYLPEKLNVKA